MPQLDINTFSYQYIAIILLLILVYTTLSYIVLPLLLRLMLIRNSFLLSQQKLSGILMFSSPTAAQLLVSKKPIYVNYLLNTILGSIAPTAHYLSTLLKSTLSFTKGNRVYSCTGFYFVNDAVFNYLILFLSIDLINETNE